MNGSPTKEFAMEKGLRQRDPLSPFLFNLVVESLSYCLKKALDQNMLRGFFLGNNKVHVSYLQFVDDTILFLEPKLEYLVDTKRILHCLEMALGLKINFHKSCAVKMRKKIKGEEDKAMSFNCRKATLPINYLGSILAKIIGKWLTVIVGRGNRAKFWKDVWWEAVLLKMAYPRIHALVVNKDGIIQEFGRWQDEVWTWDVQLRKRVFD
ncbi:hypothetical protein Ddye_025954 [Dipteronia dyeriana]|uniref:Reverse transcriptase domain-containing protein n=1 Tax=Dipteronia dyeriana TaxID=168575 RepID=A0AAD9WNP6_9ROSI|nr:hypothetical protein Ddye_025954 [Dipteronia dyeriana]